MGKTLRVTIVGALLAALLLGSAQASFTDTEGHWAYSAISKWSEQYGIIKGYENGTFQPNSSITRGAFSVILDRVMHYQTTSAAETFTDTLGTWCESEVLKLNAAGVMLGNEGRALIWDTISRQEAVTMVARAFGIPEAEEESAYADAGHISDFAKGYVAAMARYLTDTGENLFRPRDAITRAEVVSLLDNMVSVLYQKSGSYSEEVNGNLMVNAPDVVLANMHIAGDLIVAPGATTAVTMKNVSVDGHIRNFSSHEVAVDDTPQVPDTPVTPPNPPAPTGSALTPTGNVTGETIAYSGKQIPVLQGVKANDLDQSGFYWENGRLNYGAGNYTARFGIDVSAYQNRACPDTTIDWEAAAADGVNFAMIRVGLRGTSSGKLNADAFYAKNLEGAYAAGIEAGAYFFAQAVTVEEAIEEADFVISLLEGHNVTGPVAYDWEMHDSSYRVYGTDPGVASACALAFCDRIAQAGYQPMIYVGNYVGYIKYGEYMDQLSKYPLWFAEYKTTASEKLYPTFYYQPNYWQYSSSGTVAGITGNVDCNLQLIPR
ncbi:S-layer homology domain-containing protein [Oscillibacter sp. MSJ-2]|uniref:S-layer homology domain-containing protein n=1 Tax=Dysosmobacter acutus TaxID=2841504 RepID=A0ABS6F9N6_9FIRM|nr:GH25 family lysozyme [Dysosmobacter acutus]MBU5626993.1 S-layer homology domain-containing protein [Dysosmobacter acutus]